jgi:hypothetical protein
MASPLLDQHLGFSERCEDFHVQQLVSEFRVEALAIAVFPRTAWLDIKRLDADPSKPASHVLRDELRPALSRLLVCCAKMHGVAMFHAAAVMASHLSIAAARNCRIVLREIRCRWTLKVL